MNTQKIIAALALAVALGAAAPAFADDQPGLAVERLTQELMDTRTQSEVQPVTTQAPELG